MRALFSFNGNGRQVTCLQATPEWDLAQPGRKEPLAVFGSEFTIAVRVTIGAGVPGGALTAPAQLRYQACNDTVCFPPTRASAQWTLDVLKD